MSEQYLEIWPSQTGILDLSEGGQELASRELRSARNLWLGQRKQLEGSEALAIFSERLAREWAIETGLIENLYQLDRGVTHTLIEQGFQTALIEHGSTNKPREYVVRLLVDQKEALEGLFSFIRQDRSLTTSYIKELHGALTRSQLTADSVDPQGNRTQVELLRGEWKRWPNYPMKNGKEIRYCPPEHTAAEMDRLVEMYQNHESSGLAPEVSSAWLHHRFTQIHPFQDGNGRVARALASLVFMKAGLFPLVVTRDNKAAYLDALEEADGGDLAPLVKLFARLQLDRHRRATNLADKIQNPPQSLDEALSGLVRAVSLRQTPNGATESRVTSLRDLVNKQLTALASKAAPSFRALGPKFGVQVSRSTSEDSDLHLAASRSAGATAFGVLPIRPCAWASVDFHVPDVRRMVFHIGGVDPNLDGLVQVIAFEADGSSQPPVLSSEPLEWYPDESEASIVARLDDWAEQAFIQGLHRVQQSL